MFMFVVQEASAAHVFGFSSDLVGCVVQNECVAMQCSVQEAFAANVSGVHSSLVG